jgi:thioredoxin 2
MAASRDAYFTRCPSCGAANRVPASSEGRTGKCGSCHAALSPLYRTPVALTDRSFDDFVRDYPGPILAEFWAPW